MISASVTRAGCAKTAERIDVVFGVEISGDSWNTVLNDITNLHPPRRWRRGSMRSLPLPNCLDHFFLIIILFIGGDYDTIYSTTTWAVSTIAHLQCAVWPGRWPLVQCHPAEHYIDKLRCVWSPRSHQWPTKSVRGPTSRHARHVSSARRLQRRAAPRRTVAERTWEWLWMQVERSVMTEWRTGDVMMRLQLTTT